MGSITSTTTVDVTTAQAYKFVANPRNAPRYISAIRKIASGPEGPPTEGQVWDAEAEFMGKVRHINLKLAELRTDSRVRYTISGDPNLEITIDLRPDAISECAEITLTVEASSVPTFLMSAVLGNMLAGDLRRLNDILEQNG